MLGVNDLPKKIRMRCLRASYRVCGRRALLPKSLQIPLPYNPSELSARSGGFGDVWKGKHRGQDVAAKAVRVGSPNDLERIRKVRSLGLLTLVKLIVWSRDFARRLWHGGPSVIQTCYLCWV